MTDEEKAAIKDYERYLKIKDKIKDREDRAFLIEFLLNEGYKNGLAEGRKKVEGFKKILSRYSEKIAEQEETIDAQDDKINFYVSRMNEHILKNKELEKQLDCYKALESHYEEIEEDAKAIAKENEELKSVCDFNCPVHKLATHNTCLTCPAVRNSPHHDLKNVTDEELQKIIKDAEAEMEM